MKFQVLIVGELGPGAYNDESKVTRKVKDNRSGNFKSTAPRFVPNCPGANAFNYPSSYSNPGPADYSLNGNQGITGKKVRKVRPSTSKYSERKNNFKTTPSIPSELIYNHRSSYTKKWFHR